MARLLSALAAGAALAAALPLQAQASPRAQSARAALALAAGRTAAPAAQLEAGAARSGGRRVVHAAGGLPVLGSEAVVAAGLVIDGTRGPLSAPARPAVSRVRAVAAARKAAAGARLRAAPDAQLVAVPRGSRSWPAWRVRLSTARPRASLEVLVHARTGEVMRVRDRLRRAGAAMLFDPNPVTTLGALSGLADQNDAATALLSSLRRPRSLERLDPGGCLRGRWVRAVLPSGEVCAPAADFRGVDRDDERFEALMAYFHIDRAREAFAGLGITALPEHRVLVIANALDDDNSWFDPGTFEIALGAGGVDDGEDGEIAVHEYAHAIQSEASPDFGEGEEAGAIGEGFADYVAASLSARFSPSPAFDACFADWDGSLFGGCLRRLDTAMAARDLAGYCGGSIHCAGQAWSGALWDIRKQIGADAADRVAVQSSALLPAGGGFQAASLALVAADRLMHGGANEQVIRRALAQRGLLITDEADGQPGFAASIRRGDKARGAFSGPGDDHDLYRLDLRAGDTLLAGVRARGGRFVLRLLAPDGQQFASAPDGSGLAVRVPSAGAWMLDVTAMTSSGWYSLETASRAKVRLEPVRIVGRQARVRAALTPSWITASWLQVQVSGRGGRLPDAAVRSVGPGRAAARIRLPGAGRYRFTARLQTGLGEVRSRPVVGSSRERRG